MTSILQSVRPARIRANEALPVQVKLAGSNEALLVPAKHYRYKCTLCGIDTRKVKTIKQKGSNNTQDARQHPYTGSCLALFSLLCCTQSLNAAIIPLYLIVDPWSYPRGAVRECPGPLKKFQSIFRTIFGLLGQKNTWRAFSEAK
jgi:hypothetical protein